MAPEQGTVEERTEVPKRRLLWISDTPRLKHIGQSIVTREILNRLHSTGFWDICVLGYADKNVKNPIDVPYKVAHIVRSEMKDASKVIEKIRNAFSEGPPDVIVFSHDVFLFPTIVEVKKAFIRSTWVGYLTIDGIPIFSGWKNLFYAYDLILLPSEWAKKELLNKWLDLEVDVVPYGVDHSIFRPPKDGRTVFKQVLEKSSQASPTSKKLLVSNCFVGIYVGANQSRKNLGAIYYGWKEFAKDKNDVRFYLLTHSALIEQYAGTYALGSFLDANYMEIIPIEIDQEWLVRLMAMSDVLLHPAMGEGFGLTIMEALSCGTVPIVCDYSGHTDFCNKKTSYKVNWVEYVGSYDQIRAVAMHSSVTKQLQKAYHDWKSGAIEKKREAAMKKASEYSWERTAEEMHQRLQEAFERKNKVRGLVLRHII